VTDRVSAGLLLHRVDGRHAAAAIEVLLVHMGGPFWARKDVGAWTLPKGEPEPGEALLDAARREFTEETGAPPPAGDYVPLGAVRQKGGKVVHAWAVHGDFDVDALVSTTFELEWPPRSGRRTNFPEVDRAAWFGLDAARERIVSAQATFLDRLGDALA
jgi:predicted NUDIX family NTP pyrophosphohydrolase